jgi:hypothetical protein
MLRDRYRPLEDEEYPSVRDMADSYRDDDAIDIGWQYDKSWTARRIIFTALIVIAVSGFLLYSFSGVIDLLQNGGAPVYNAIPPTPMPNIPLI